MKSSSHRTHFSSIEKLIPRECGVEFVKSIAFRAQVRSQSIIADGCCNATAGSGAHYSAITPLRILSSWEMCVVVSQLVALIYATLVPVVNALMIQCSRDCWNLN